MGKNGLVLRKEYLLIVRMEISSQYSELDGLSLSVGCIVANVLNSPANDQIILSGLTTY